MKTVGLFQLLVCVTRGGRRRLCRSAKRKGESFTIGIGRLRGLTRQRLVHPPVAGDAAVESGDIAEVVVDRQLGQPDLINPKGAVECVENGQFEHRFADVRRPVLERLRELQKLLAVVGQILGRRIFGSGDFSEGCLEFFAVGVGRLVFQRGLGHLGTFGVGQREQRVEPRLGRCLGDSEFVIGPILVEFGLPELELSGKQVLPELGPFDDVPQTFKKVSTKCESGAFVLLIGENVEVNLGTVRGFDICRNGADPVEKLLCERGIEAVAAGLGKGLVELLRSLLVTA